MKETLLHILIPSYNCGDYISAALDSVLNEGVKSIKITVIDNASTDNTYSIVKKYEARGVEYIKNPINIGGIENHNKCLDFAIGKYVKLMSADDVLINGILTKQLSVLENNLNVGIVSCNCILTNENLFPIKSLKFLNGKWSGKKAIKKSLWKIGNFIGGPTNVMIRRSNINGHRMNSKFTWTADLMFFCSILKSCDYIGLDTEGFYYRRHNGAISNVSCPESIRFISDAKFILDFSNTKIEFLRWLYRYHKLILKNYIFAQKKII